MLADNDFDNLGVSPSNKESVFDRLGPSSDGPRGRGGRAEIGEGIEGATGERVRGEEGEGAREGEGSGGGVEGMEPG